MEKQVTTGDRSQNAPHPEFSACWFGNSFGSDPEENSHGRSALIVSEDLSPE